MEVYYASCSGNLLQQDFLIVPIPDGGDAEYKVLGSGWQFRNRASIERTRRATAPKTRDSRAKVVVCGHMVISRIRCVE